MKARVVETDSNDETTVSEETNDANNLETKVAMLARLHDDFGVGKITTLKTTGGKVELIMNAAHLKGTFTLKFESKKPYLIDGLGIQAGKKRDTYSVTLQFFQLNIAPSHLHITTIVNLKRNLSM